MFKCFPSRDIRIPSLSGSACNGSASSCELFTEFIMNDELSLLGSDWLLCYRFFLV